MEATQEKEPQVNQAEPMQIDGGALIQTLSNQRNAALNECAQLGAMVITLRAENEALKAELAKRPAAKGAKK